MNIFIFVLIGVLFLLFFLLFASVKSVSGELFNQEENLKNTQKLLSTVVNPINVPIVLDKDAFLPVRAHGSEDACYDVIAPRNITLSFGRQIIPTGIRFKIPTGIAAIVLPTSGNTSKGIAVISKRGESVIKDYRINADAIIGVADPGYIGEIGVLFNNHLNPMKTDGTFTIKRGTKLGQIMFVRTVEANFVPTDKLEDTERSTNGFGSTDNNNL